MSDLHVAVQGDAITVTEPGTDHTVIYKKRIEQPNLVMTYVSFDLTMRAAFEFRARSWIAD